MLKTVLKGFDPLRKKMKAIENGPVCGQCLRWYRLKGVGECPLFSRIEPNDTEAANCDSFMPNNA